MFDTVKFICAVKNRPALYNFKLEEYKNRDLKIKLWDEVAKIMYDNWDEKRKYQKNIMCKELQQKWRSLRDQFVKARKAEKVIRSGANTIKKRKYLYYDQLQFLIIQPDARESSCNLPSLLLVKEDEVTQETEKSFDCDITAASPPSTLPNAVSTRSRKRAMQALDDGITTTTNISQQSIDLQRKEKKDDEWGNAAFMKSLVPFLDTMPPDMLLQARTEIMEVVRKCTTMQSR
ncbi:uncharacterized protein [Onthophagus taurus]|uniref:uncharacterized protein isoform X1 n=2 Tax=Onthophagus taurus TaxID=166361 RepID=UPI0039BDCD18